MLDFIPLITANGEDGIAICYYFDKIGNGNGILFRMLCADVEINCRALRLKYSYLFNRDKV